MTRAIPTLVLAGVLVTAGSVYGQGYYGSYYGVYPPGYGTIAGSYMAGLGEAIRAQGQYNLMTSEAAVNIEEARRKFIENRARATAAYFEMRRLNREARIAEGPQPASPSQAAALAKADAPKPLGISQWDPVTGQIAWPKALRDELFATERAQIEEAAAAIADGPSAHDYSTILLVRASAGNMLEKLRANIEILPPTDFIAAKKFLDSLVFTLTGSPA